MYNSCNLDCLTLTLTCSLNVSSFISSWNYLSPFTLHLTKWREQSSVQLSRGQSNINEVSALHRWKNCLRNPRWIEREKGGKPEEVRNGCREEMDGNVLMAEEEKVQRRQANQGGSEETRKMGVGQVSPSGTGLSHPWMVALSLVAGRTGTHCYASVSYVAELRLMGDWLSSNVFCLLHFQNSEENRTTWLVGGL